MIGVYLTHPQVAVDPLTPVPQWSLSEVGRSRALLLSRRPWVGRLRRIVSSEERKALDTAALVSETTGVAVEVGAAMGENDRSATGFLEPAAFERAADAFFAYPDQSWSGWERASDASMRISGAVERVLETHDASKPILFVGHGAVGTLLKCRLAGKAISRKEDQPAGGGNIFAFRLADRTLLCDWTPMETFDWSADAT